MDPKKVAESSSFQKFLDSRSWKFYVSIVTGITIVGTVVLSNQHASHKRRPTYETVPDLNDDTYETMTENVVSLLSAQQRLTASVSLRTKANQAFDEKRYNDAINLYTQAIRFSAEPILYANRSACYAVLGQVDRVISDCTESLRLNPTYIKALQRRALAYEDKNDKLNALFDYTTISILEGFQNMKAAQATERLLKSISEQKAKMLIKTMAHRLPSPVFITAYLDSFRPDTVTDVLPYALDEDYGDTYYVKARASLAQKKYYEAFEHIKAAVELGCSNPAMALNLKGTLTYLEGQSDLALEIFNQALVDNPSYVQVLIKKSNVYMEKGDLKVALDQLEKAVEKDALDPDIYYHRGQVYYISGQYEQALADYATCMQLNPTFVYAQIQWAVAQHKAKHSSEAENMFQTIADQFPTNAEVFNYYGEILADQGKMQGAVDMFNKAMTLDPGHPIPYINKAMILYQNLGKTDEAIQLCKNALDADPACDAAVASLAQMLIEQDRPTEALVYYEKAIDLARTQTELEHAISHVEATKAQIRFAKEYPNAVAKLRTLK